MDVGDVAVSPGFSLSKTSDLTSPSGSRTPSNRSSSEERNGPRGVWRKLSTDNVLAQAGRSASNLGLSPMVFHFEMTVESVQNIGATGKAVVIWERGSAVSATRPVQVNTAGETRFDEVLSREVTLFAVTGSKGYKSKVFKVAVRSGHVNGRSLHKMRLDLANFVEGAAESQRKVTAKLSRSASITFVLVTRFVRSGKRLKRSSEASDSEEQSSMGSYMSSSDVDTDDYLDDIDMDDVESETDDAFASLAVSLQSAEHDWSSRSQSRKRGGAQSSFNRRVLEQRLLDAQLKVERLERENEQLRDRVGGNASVAMENEVLRRQIAEVSILLEKPPAAVDLVRELTETKLLLANEWFEAAEVTHEVVELQKRLAKRKKLWFRFVHALHRTSHGF